MGKDKFKPNQQIKVETHIHADTVAQCSTAYFFSILIRVSLKAIIKGGAINVLSINQAPPKTKLKNISSTKVINSLNPKLTFSS